MKNLIVKNVIPEIVLGYIIFAIFSGCASSKPKPHGAEYTFVYNDKTFHIRSYFSNQDGENVNTLIGKDLVAVDFDQDGIIDKIDRGKITLQTAQGIYDTGLGMGNKEKKLQVRVPPNSTYAQNINGILYEIKTIKPLDSDIFNEIKISDNRQVISRVAIFVDQKSDGTLDSLIKGNYDIEKAQNIYNRLLDEGVQLGGLIKRNGMYLVNKQK
jgi:hypothetical protein